MKFSATLCLLFIFASGCDRNNLQTRLLSEQKLLKDSANNINERRVSCSMPQDRADAEKAQLGAVHARLIAIQSSIDSLDTVR